MRKSTYSLAVAAALWGGAANASGIHFLAEPPAAPNALPAVQAGATPLSRDIFVRQARAVGAGSNVLTFAKTPQGIAASWSSPAAANVTSTLFRDPFGGQTFITSLMMNEAPGASDPISDAAAQRVATDYLAKYPGVVDTRQASVSAIQHLMHQGQDLNKGTMTSATQDETIVRFSRSLANVSVIGPGDQAEVHVANTGAVTGQIAVWRSVRVNTNSITPILPFTQVKDAFTRQLAQELANSTDDANVTEIRFGYYSRQPGQTQGAYTPAYDFVVSFHNTDDKSRFYGQDTGARHIYVPAIDPSYMKEPLDPASSEAPQGDPAKVAFQANAPQNVPQAVPVFTVSPTTVNIDTVQQRAKKLGFADGSVRPTPRGLLEIDTATNTLLSQDTAGGEFFGHLDRLLSEKPGEAQPLDDKTAQTYALRYLIGTAGFSSDQLGTPTFSHLFNQAFDIQKNANGPQTQDETIVNYPRVVPNAYGKDPLPLIGPNSGIQVHLDNFKNITGHHALWRNYQTVAGVATPVMPFESVMPRLLRQAGAAGGNSKVLITAARFGLYERPEGTAQGYLLPAYIFDADFFDATDDSGKPSGHTTILIPASANPPESLDDETSSLDDQNALDDSRAPVIALYGDWNGDGKVDLSDVVGSLQGSAGLADGPVTSAQLAACDVSPSSAQQFPGGDGQIHLDDSLRILRTLTQLDDISNGP